MNADIKRRRNLKMYGRPNIAILIIGVHQFVR